MNPFALFNPDSVLSASTHAAERPGKTLLKAGGIDVLDLLKERLIAPETLVNLSAVPGLRGVAAKPGGSVSIGALTTLAEVAADRTIRDRYRALAFAAGEAASPQIRNVATIAGDICQRPRCWYFRSELFPCLKKGGNICYSQEGENQYHAIFGNELSAIVHPSSAATALMALDARFTVSNAKGSRVIGVRDFFVRPEDSLEKENVLEPGDIITEIELPSRTGWKTHYLAQREKQSFDWPLAEVAVAVKIVAGKCQDVRIVLGAAAPLPWRVPKAEEKLKGRAIDEAAARAAAETALEGARPLGQNGYKLDLFRVLVRRALLDV